MVKDYTHRQLMHDSSLIAEVLTEWNRVHKDEFYDINTSRERVSLALNRTRSYHLRETDVPATDTVDTALAKDILEVKNTTLFEKFPTMQEFIRTVGHVIYGDSGWTHLGRIFVSRLSAHSNISRHTDQGHYFDMLHRFHLVLSSEGSVFCWDAQRVELNQGELWNLNNSVPHWVENTGYDRTHLIWDGI